MYVHGGFVHAALVLRFEVSLCMCTFTCFGPFTGMLFYSAPRYMYVCVDGGVCVSEKDIHIYMYMYVCNACTYVRTYVHTYARMYVCTYVRMYVRMYVCMYACM